MSKTKDYFEKNGFVVLSDALSKEECEKLVSYMFELHTEGKLTKDKQCPLSDSIYGDPVFDDLLQKFAQPIGEQLGKKLIPTYTYARIYRTGEVLKRHKDRPACEISATMTLGYDAKCPWKIFFDEEKELGVDLNVGEMAVYAGCDILHWRPIFKGKWQIQVFFHYVDADGPYAHHSKDGRLEYGTDKMANVSPSLEKKELTMTFPNPLFDTIIIPNHDQTFPGYLCIDKKTAPELSFTDKECQQILDMLSETYPNTASVGGTLQSSKIARKIRSAEIYVLENDQENRWIYEKIAKVVSFANKYHFDYDITGITHAIQLIEYSSETEIKGHYDWHTDSGPGEPATRKISLTVQLSDSKEYEDCELLINNHGEQVTATKERGSIHLFPSYMLHKVTPISKGTRYALVIWIHGSRRFK